MARWEVGDTWLPEVTITDEGVPVAPATVVLQVRDPANERETVATTTPVLGTYRGEVPLTSDGLWVAQFETTSPAQVEGLAILVGVAPIDDLSLPWRPSVAQVAAIVHSHTRGYGCDVDSATEQGTFTATTRPTYAQAVELIGLACSELSGLLQGRSPCTEALTGAATSAVAYRDAALAIISCFPELSEADGESLKALMKMWEQASASVSVSVLDQCPMIPGEVSEDGWPIGRGPRIALVGWHTRF